MSDDLLNTLPQVIPQVPEPARLNPQASYIVAGGLGGLGRSMIRRLVKLDVRHLILVSRSGAASEPAKATVEELRSSGVKVKVYSCDISDKASLSAVLEDVKGKMPPIRGCIQSAMVLRVR
jgi:NAD(P)-dependent dehydrogenase (short-subunit alcohol dehydrogenase family)